MTNTNLISEITSSLRDIKRVINMIKRIPIVVRVSVIFFLDSIPTSYVKTTLLRRVIGNDSSRYYLIRSSANITFSKISDYNLIPFLNKTINLKILSHSIHFSIMIFSGKKIHIALNMKNYKRKSHNYSTSGFRNPTNLGINAVTSYLSCNRFSHNFGSCRYLVISTYPSGLLQDLLIYRNFQTTLNIDNYSKENFENICVPNAVSLRSIITSKKNYLVDIKTLNNKKAFSENRLQKHKTELKQDLLRAIPELVGVASIVKKHYDEYLNFDIKNSRIENWQKTRIGYYWPDINFIPTSNMIMIVYNLEGLISQEKIYRMIRRMNRYLSLSQINSKKCSWGSINIRGTKFFTKIDSNTTTTTNNKINQFLEKIVVMSMFGENCCLKQTYTN